MFTFSELFIRVWHFGFKTSRVQKFSNIQYWKNLVSKKVSDSVSKKESDSVSKRIWYKKSIGFVIEQIWYRKKWRMRYWKYLVSKKPRIQWKKNLQKILGFVCLKHVFVKFGNGIVFETLQFLIMLSDSVSKKCWIQYQQNLVSEKYQIRYWKKLVSEKVLDSVLFRFWLLSHTLLSF